MPSENMKNWFPRKVKQKPVRTFEEYRAQCHVFLEHNYDKLYAYAYKHTKEDSDLAQDLVHKICEKLLSQDCGIDFTTNPMTYIWNIMKSRQWTEYKRFVRDGKRSAEWVEKQQAYEDETEDRLESQTVISQLIEKLDPKERPYIEAYLDGLNHTQIAEIFNSNRYLITKRMKKIFAKLRKKAQTLPQAVE